MGRSGLSLELQTLQRFAFQRLYIQSKFEMKSINSTRRMAILVCIAKRNSEETIYPIYLFLIFFVFQNIFLFSFCVCVFEILMENVLLFLLDHLKCCHELHLDFQYVDSPQALLSPRSRHKLKTGLCFRGNIETLAIGQF